MAKCATKSEPQSKVPREIYSTIMRGIKDDATSLNVVQKLLVNTVGERDFSAQETCRLLLQLPMYRATRVRVSPQTQKGRNISSTANSS